MWKYKCSCKHVKKTRRMAIANRMCISLCNQPKAHFGLPWVCPCDNRGKSHMDEKRIQCLSNASQHVPMYPCIFNHFPVIQPISSKVRHFSTFFKHFGLPWDNHGKCYMDGKRIWCWSNAQQHIPIYLQPFTSYSKTSVGNCNFLLPLLAFNAPTGACPHWNSRKKFGSQKTRIMGLPWAVKTVWRMTIDWAV